jgi:hypothetical protein
MPRIPLSNSIILRFQARMITRVFKISAGKKIRSNIEIDSEDLANNTAMDGIDRRDNGNNPKCAFICIQFYCVIKCFLLQLLKLVLSNLRIEGDKVRYEAVKPFDSFLVFADQSSWLPSLKATRIEEWVREFVFS